MCKSSLLRKWHEELTANEASANGDKHGLRPYLPGEEWQPFVRQFIDEIILIESGARAERMWWGSKDEPYFKGVKEGGKIQVPEGLYLVNHQLLYDSKRNGCKLLRYLYRTDWDLVVVDEAHHYGKGSKCDSIFATKYRGLGRGVRPDFGAEETLNYRHILLLTATPFELEPGEMLNLLRIAGADPHDQERLSDLLGQYQRELGTFYGLRALLPENERRRAVVERLHRLRIGSDGSAGLEPLMRRYMVRNLKDTQREYALVNQKDAAWDSHPFDKFDDLKRLCTGLQLVPFTGSDALFYLELRALIQETIEGRQADKDAPNTFVAMDLQQGLSSYPQLLASQLLKGRSERASRLSRLLSQWGKNEQLHPKVRALKEVVGAIARHEIERVEREPGAWFAKIVVFNKLVAGTAPHLRKELEKEVEPLFEEMLERLSSDSAFGDVGTLRKEVTGLVRKEADRARDELDRRCQARGEFESRMLSVLILHDAGFEIGRATHAIEAFRDYFHNRAQQALFLIDFLRRGNRPLDKDALRHFLRAQMIDPVVEQLDEIINKYLDIRPDEYEAAHLTGTRLYETGIRGLSQLRERLRSPELVTRYDGEVSDDRESNRLNFNERWNPLVLIVSRVGEEGIDLQKQARYILHYDLEWNPAKMEQREGRVDREGYGHAGKAIDVRFFLLKGTYEERIFHTVMQRDQWFQILMGDQRRKLGTIGKGIDDDDMADTDKLTDVQQSEQSIGQLTLEEKSKVMVDLRPNP